MKRIGAGLSGLALGLFGSCLAWGQSYTISTFAGGGLPVNIPGTSAALGGTESVAVDPAGNVFFAVQSPPMVLRLDRSTGILNLVAGNGTYGYSGDNGPAASAQLAAPRGVAVDAAGNVYIADSANDRIRKVSNGVITTVAGNGTVGYAGDNGPATNASLYTPIGVAVDANGTLYIADSYNNRVRKVAKGVITTVAGGGSSLGDNGPATSAQLSKPSGVAVDAAGNLYIADTGNGRIRKVANEVISTVASNGLGLLSAIAVDADGNIYVADNGTDRIFRVANGVITTVAGNGAAGYGDNVPATSTSLYLPAGVAVDAAGNLYIADSVNARIRKVTNGVITTVAGGGSLLGDNGPATSAQLALPRGVAVDATGSVYIADSDQIRKVANGVITTVAGGGSSLGDNGPATSAQFNAYGVAVDASGNLYIADNYRVRQVSNGVITTVAGNGMPGFVSVNGPATSVSVSPAGVAVDAQGNLYIADSEFNSIRKVSNGVITTVAGGGAAGFSGDNGPALGAQLSRPAAVAVDAGGNLYIADTGNNRIRKVANGVITTIAGGGSSLGDNGPATSAQLALSITGSGVAVDAAGNLYITDTSHNRFRRVSGGVITTIAGNGQYGFSGDNGPAFSAQLDGPAAVAVDSAGNLYLADTGNYRVRVLAPPGGAPLVTSVFNAAGYQPGVFPGSLISIQGANLTLVSDDWSHSIVNGQLPAQLDNVSVSIGGKPAYIAQMISTQINLQVPDLAPGNAQVVVTTPTGTSGPFTVSVQAVGPAFWPWPNNQPVATHLDYSLAAKNGTFAGTATVAAKPGEIITLWGTGFGPTTPAVPAGQLPGNSAGAGTQNPVTATLNGAAIPVIGAALSSYPGDYQVAIQIPATLADGDYPLVASANGVSSPTVTLSVQH